MFVILISGIALTTASPGNANFYPLSQSNASFQSSWPAVGYGVGSMRFERFGTDEGLSENTVLTILQDSQGFMWFGTQEGLNKFDGYVFTVYQADPVNADSLTDDYITVLLEAGDGAIWVGTYYGGLNRFDQNKNSFTHFTPDALDPGSLPDDRVNALYEDSNGRIWVGTRGGLSRFNPNSQDFDHFQHDSADEASISSNVVQVIFQDRDQNIWVGTPHGLNLFEESTGSFKRFLTDFETGIENVVSICNGEGNNIWLGTNGGLVNFNTKNFTYNVFLHVEGNPKSLGSNQINIVYRDPSGNLWVGFKDDGISLVSDWEGKQGQIISFSNQPSDENSLSNDDVRTIFQDRSGVMWFGTFGGGVNRANPATRAFGRLKHNPEDLNTIASDQIVSLAFDPVRKSLWIGTLNAGLDQMNLETGEFTHFRHIPGDDTSLNGDNVNLLYVSIRGDLYVGTQGGFLQTYDEDLLGFVPAKSMPDTVEDVRTTTAITEDSNGVLWLSQEYGELVRIDPESNQMGRFSLGTGLPDYIQDDMVLAIHADDSGHIWMGTENQGLVMFDPGMGTFLILNKDGTSKGPSHNSITDIHADHAGMIWLGTGGGGLNRFELGTGEFTYYTTSDGIPSNRILGIEEDLDGNLWLSTANGLVRFDPTSGEVRRYDTRDGLQENAFNQDAHTSSSDGALFFGGMNGLNAFYPEMIEENQVIPAVVITKVSLFSEILVRDIDGCTASLTFTHDQNFISFEFAALDFTAPEDNQFAYMMEGVDEDYILTSDKHNADYPDLRPGRYRFKVLGSNNDGVWNTAPTCIEIKIKQPFWATWWFIGLVGLFLAGSVVGGYRWRLSTIEKQRQELALDVFERTTEIERRRQMASGLSEVVRLLNTNQPLEKSLDFIVQQSIGLTAASKAVIFERQDNHVVARSCYPEGETYSLDLSDPNSNTASCLLESVFLNRLLIYSRLNPATLKSDSKWELVSGEYRTALCTPLLVDEEVYGGLVLYYGEDRTFTPEEINLAHALADQASLAIANDRLKGKAQDAAVTAERNRLARDLHDAVTQTLFSTSLIAEVMPKIWKKNPDTVEQRLEELRQLTRGALGEMRTLLMELRPSSLDEAQPRELFKHLADAFTGRSGVPVELNVEPSIDCIIPVEVKNVFYRIAQEGLNNIFKHAEATRVWFRYTCGEEAITLTIIDDGLGFDQKDIPPGHMGLGIMSERAKSIQADLNVVSRPGEGTTLRLVWRFDRNPIK